MVTHLLSTFGMYEMEAAAEEVVSKAIKYQDWNISITYDEISDKSGFLQLIYANLLKPYLLSKREFGPSEYFIEKVSLKYGTTLRNLKPLMDPAKLYFQKIDFQETAKAEQ